MAKMKAKTVVRKMICHQFGGIKSHVSTKVGNAKFNRNIAKLIINVMPKSKMRGG